MNENIDYDVNYGIYNVRFIGIELAEVTLNGTEDTDGTNDDITINEDKNAFTDLSGVEHRVKTEEDGDVVYVKIGETHVKELKAIYTGSGDIYEENLRG